VLVYFGQKKNQIINNYCLNIFNCILLGSVGTYYEIIVSLLDLFISINDGNQRNSNANAGLETTEKML